MAKYTEKQLKELRKRWEGHEEKLKTLIPIIKVDPKWEESEEYKALIEAIGLLPEGVEAVERDLRGAFLNESDLSGAHLNGADLTKAYLNGSNLTGAHLRGAHLFKTSLGETYPSDFNPKEGNIYEDMRKTSLSGADLREADLREAYLVWADLAGAYLMGSDLTGAHMNATNLTGSHLNGAHLSGVDLSSAHLTEASLVGADLTGASLFWADLSGADLTKSDISGADLTGANLSGTKSWLALRWNSKHKRGKKLKSSERRTKFGCNDIRDANWAGAALLKRYVEDENFLAEYIESAQPALKVLSWQSWRSSFPRLPRKIWLCLWKLTCNYGRSFWRWAEFSAIIAGVFAVIYWRVFGCDSIAFDVDKLNGVQPDFLGYLYYSVVTFTTLGFGDIVPLTNWARLAVGIEVVLGYIMLGGLISIFANKLARRA